MIHEVRETIVVGRSRTLNLHPCSEHRFAPGAGIIVEGILNVSGRADRPIYLRPLDPGGTWGGIEVTDGRLSIQHAVIERAGGWGSALNVHERTANLHQAIFVNNVTIRGSAGIGLSMDEGAEFLHDSTGLTITGSASFPASIGVGALTWLPPGRYTGNALDEIEATGGRAFEHWSLGGDLTIRDRGVPYRLAAGDGPERAPGLQVALGTLTIEPGVVLRFPLGGALVMGERLSGKEDFVSGKLVAVGTREKPIVFTSGEAAPRAGDWHGVFFPHEPREDNRMEYVRVEYAGGAGAGASCPVPGVTEGSRTAEGAVVFPDVAPATAFIKNCTIVHSRAHGIVRGWPGDSLIDLAATNEFSNIAWCQQSHPVPSGACPPDPPCAR
jgi:hypothetical protein